MWPLAESCGCAVGREGLELPGAEPLRSRRLLSHHAEWTWGDLECQVRERLRELRALGVAPAPGGPERWGLDLGCGPGVSALALARLGFQVAAVDRCRVALAGLGARDATRSVEVVASDIVDFVARNTRVFDAALCLGDALPHLPSPAHVTRLLRHLPRTLRPGGRAALAFRDYASARQGRHFERLHRGPECTLTRVLDVGPERVEIHDLLHERRGAECEVSVRRATALRIDPCAVGRVLSEVGLEARRWDPGPGRIGWIARRRS